MFHKKRLNLFTISSLGLDNWAQTLGNWSTGGTDHFWFQFITGTANGGLQVVKAAVVDGSNLPLQNGLNCKVHHIEVWRRRWPTIFGPKAVEMLLAPLLNPFRSVTRSSVLLKTIWRLPVLPLDPGKYLILQHLLVDMLVHFDALRDENDDHKK